MKFFDDLFTNVSKYKFYTGQNVFVEIPYFGRNISDPLYQNVEKRIDKFLINFQRVVDSPPANVLEHCTVNVLQKQPGLLIPYVLDHLNTNSDLYANSSVGHYAKDTPFSMLFNMELNEEKTREELSLEKYVIPVDETEHYENHPDPTTFLDNMSRSEDDLHSSLRKEGNSPPYDDIPTMVMKKSNDNDVSSKMTNSSRVTQVEFDPMFEKTLNEGTIFNLSQLQKKFRLEEIPSEQPSYNRGAKNVTVEKEQSGLKERHQSALSKDATLKQNTLQVDVRKELAFEEESSLREEEQTYSDHGEKYVSTGHSTSPPIEHSKEKQPSKLSIEHPNKFISVYDEEYVSKYFVPLPNMFNNTDGDHYEDEPESIRNKLVLEEPFASFGSQERQCCVSVVIRLLLSMPELIKDLSDVFRNNVLLEPMRKFPTFMNEEKSLSLNGITEEELFKDRIPLSSGIVKFGKEFEDHIELVRAQQLCKEGVSTRHKSHPIKFDSVFKVCSNFIPNKLSKYEDERCAKNVFESIFFRLRS